MFSFPSSLNTYHIMASKKPSRESQLSIAQYVPAAAASRSNLLAPFLYRTNSIRALPPMILQKTGWRIKQLISHRRIRSFDDGEISAADRERRLAGKPSRRPSKRRSWVGNATSIDVQFLESNSEASQRTDITAHSSSASSDSLCGSANDDSPHSLFSEPRSPKILYLQPSADLSGDAKVWRLIFPEETNSPPPSKSTFDLLEALALEPTDDEKTPTPTIKNTRGSSESLANPEIREGVEQLIRETDEAFGSISTVWVPDESTPVETNEDTKEEPMQTDTDLERHVLKKQRKVPVTRTNSISKAKRTKSTKKKARLLDLAASGPPSPPISGSPSPTQRWTLVDVTDNISDIFTGRMFKMEVNEMIDTTRIGRIVPTQSTARIQGLKHNPESKESIDTISSHGTDEIPGTPNDPFSLESLPIRLGASGIVPTPPDPKSSASGTANAPVIPLKSILRSSKRDSAIYVGNGISVLTHPANKDISMPPGPSLRQRSRSFPKQPSLPTIQETPPLSPDSKPTLRKPNSVAAIQSSSHSDMLASPGSEKSSDWRGDKHILLNSTPFTLTSPHFQHGSIRLPQGQKRSFRSTNSPVEVTPDAIDTSNPLRHRGDTGLDWTAFQMAISGGTGNYLMGGTDPEADAEGNIEEIEEIIEWWKEFGFEGMGRLVDGVTAHRRKKSKLNIEDVGISYEMDANSIRGGKVNSGDVQAVVREVQQVSLPPSPIDDLVVLEGKGYLDLDLVPMGFNLSHDLDDYLKWESTQTEALFSED